MQDLTLILADLIEIEGQPMTTSRLVAKRFKKLHKNVLQAIKKIEAQQPEFSRLNFQPVEYADAKGEMRPEYRMTRDGFSLLAMGFTGDEALTWKVAYINAFNWMADQLTGRRNELMNQHNEACLEFRMERGVASLAGRTLNRWKSKKPILDERITSIEKQMQIPLLLC